MKDLKKIKTPFGLLKPKVQKALMAHGGPYEVFDGKDWGDCKSKWLLDVVYRVKPSAVAAEVEVEFEMEALKAAVREWQAARLGDNLGRQVRATKALAAVVVE